MALSDEVQIKFLNDCQNHIPLLAQLLYEESISRLVNTSSVAMTIARLNEYLNKKELPLGIVAIYNDIPIGMACLRETDILKPDFGPWLRNLVVDPGFRKQKVGETLVENIKALAKSFNHKFLYLLAFDPVLSNWYLRLGWQNIGEELLLGRNTVIMSSEL